VLAVFALFHEISWRRWINSPLRSLMVVLGIALGVALYVATQAAGASMQAAFSDFVTRVSGRADLNVQSSGTSVPAELVQAVAEVFGVAHAAPTLELSAQTPDLGESLFVLGIDFLGDRAEGSCPVARRRLRRKQQERCMRRQANLHRVTRIRSGACAARNIARE